MNNCTQTKENKNKKEKHPNIIYLLLYINHKDLKLDMYMGPAEFLETNKVLLKANYFVHSKCSD